MSGASYSVRLLADGSCPVVALAGEIDMAASDAVWEEVALVLAVEREGLVLDLRDVTFMDSRGLTVIIRAKTALGPSRQLTVRSPRPVVDRCLRILGLDQLALVESE